jgi:hypothetical protein
MDRPLRRNRSVRALRAGLLLAIVLSALISALGAESALRDTDAEVAKPADASRFDRLEQSLQSVRDENRRLADEVRALQEQTSARSLEEQPSPQWCECPVALPTDSGNLALTGYVSGYDGGFVIVPEDLEASPFSLKVNNQNTFRYTGFARDAMSWTDSAGNVNPIFSNSNFMIPRGRLILSGKAFLPNLSYLLNIDYNTVTSNPIGFRAYALGYRFSRAVEMFVGQTKVPGTREWLLSSWVAQEGPDRSMATTFFRPSLSQGIWFTGEPIDGLRYDVMVSNGFNTLNVPPSQLNNRFCWSGSVWWEPWGEFGPGYSDIEDHQELAVRAGISGTFSVEEGSQANSDTPENSSIRLSDGTIITQPGAFAPGVILKRYNISLVATDLAFKYRGWSLSTEGYFQELSSLQGNGPLPLSSTRAYGGFLAGGFMVLPRKVELYARTSCVTGAYGSGTEYASGLNWFILEGKSNLRFTFDAAWLEHSPADQNRTGFVAGQTGLLIRTQINTSF